MPANPEMHGGDAAVIAAPAGAVAESAARPASRRAAGQDPHKRRQIIEGAKRCFLKMGFEAASMNDITAEAGVSKGTVYVYFADKEDLFASLCDEERTRHLQFAQTQLEVAPNMEEALRRFGIALATRLTSTEVIRAMRMVLAVAERMPKLAARFFGPEPFSGLTIIKNYLDRKVAEGELEIADTDFAGRQFVDLAMAGLFKRRLFGSMPEEASPETIAAIVDTAVDMFLAYYRKRA